MLPEIKVKIDADTTGLTKGLAAATDSLAKFGKVAGAAIAGAVVSFAALTKSALDAFGAIADKAKSAGIGTNLFQSITTLAGQSGVAIDQVSIALDTFSKNAGLAAVNKGKLVSQLQALNPELLRNLQLTTDQEERLRLAADAIDAASSASQKAALATALFGDAGVKMASVFQGGAAAIDAWSIKARNMGLIIDRDLIAKADELGDSFDTAAKALDNQLKTAFINIAPLMVDAARLAADVAIGINKIIDASRALADKSREGLERERSDLMQLLEGATSLSDMNANPMSIGMDEAQFEAMKSQLASIDAELRGRAMDDLRLRLAELPKQIPEIATTGSGPTTDTNAIDALREQNDARLAVIGEGLAAIEKQEQEHQDRLEAIRSASLYRNLDAASSIFGSISSIMKTQGDKQIGIQKGIASAGVAISTAAGVMKAIEQFGWPGGLLPAAAVAAEGMAQLASINSASASGSNGAGGVKGGGSAAAAEPAMNRTLTVQGITPGQIFSGDAMRDFMERMLDMQRDGYQVVLA